MVNASLHPAGNGAVTTVVVSDGGKFDNSTAHNETAYIAPLFLSPVPFYGTIIIGTFCILVMICCFACAIMYCRASRKKKQKKPPKQLSLPRASVFFGAEKVQPDMEDLVENDEKDDNFCGRLHYSLEYSVGNAALTVTVIECQQLTAMDIGGSSDPYVRVRLLPKKKPVFHTKTKQKTVDPFFHETFVFEDVPSTDVVKRTLLFHVLDHDVIGSDDLIGHVSVPLSSIDLSQQVHDAWVDLQKPGELGGEEAALGDICISLRYVPARGLLTVVVLEAKNLPCNDRGEDPDTFVKLSISKDGKKIKLKRTTVRKKSCNPYFNETFTFDVPLAHIKTITLKVSVAVPTIAGFGHSIGCIELSSLFGGPHWHDMLSNPRHPVARWHRLIPPGNHEKEFQRIYGDFVKPSMLDGLIDLLPGSALSMQFGSEDPIDASSSNAFMPANTEKLEKPRKTSENFAEENTCTQTAKKC